MIFLIYIEKLQQYHDKVSLIFDQTIFIIVLGDSSFNAQKLAMMKEGLKYVKGNQNSRCCFPAGQYFQSYVAKQGS